MDFNNWLARGGARMYGVKAAEVAEGWRGILAADDIRPGLHGACLAHKKGPRCEVWAPREPFTFGAQVTCWLASLNAS